MSNSIVLTRIDDRLIHGQVMTSWLNYTSATKIMVVDDRSAQDPFLKTVLKNAVPKNVGLGVFTAEKAANRLIKGFPESDRVIILVKYPATICKMMKLGVKFDKVNIGGMGAAKNREKFYKNISASEEEKEMLKTMIDAGTKVEIQIIAEDAAGDAPLGIYVMMPSSIPATPFETNGADFTAEDMKQWKDHPLVLGLGEVMCYPAVLSKEEQIMKKLELCKGMVIDGHAPGLSGEDLKAYVEAGVMTDHECTSFEEAKEKCLAGMKILVREGSAARNVENIVPGLVKEPEFIAHFMFCTDDKHLDTIENEGHISYNIKKSIQLGMNPISAVKMATYNAAKTYGLNDIGVLEEGKDADIVILDSLESVEVHSVYKQGRIVNTEFFTKEAKPVNESMLHTVVLKNISKDKIQVKAEGKIPVIGMIPGQIVTKFLQEEVPSKDGLFTPDSEYSKLCVFERHRGTGNAAAAPIKGYGITNGAIATSVAHDSHNIIAAGDNDEDIIKAVQTIEEIQGGYALVSEGRVLGTLPLTVAGLLSQKPAKDIQKGIDELLQKAWKLGISRDIDPFITLSFMALPVIPSLRLTDLGLVDVDTFQLLKS